MIIFNSINEISNIEPVAVALGNFDGIHAGHKVLIDAAVKIAGEKGIRSAVFTFSQHPRNVMAGKTVVKNIIYEDEKIELLKKAGIDYLFSLPFDEMIRNQSPEEFVDEVLIDKFNVSTAVCGFNFTYGHKALGTAESLVAEGKKKGFDVKVIDSVKVNDDIVSSTLIRECITDGDISRASELLGRSYSIRGTIIKGNQFGRQIGFPTCNIVIDETMVTPANGVYVTKCYIGGVRYNSVTNVGNKPTVGSFDKNIETNVFDFNKDVYGEEIVVEFIKQLREEKKFAGIDELRDQLMKDVEHAKDYHNILRIGG